MNENYKVYTLKNLFIHQRGFGVMHATLMPYMALMMVGSHKSDHGPISRVVNRNAESDN